jgi:serine O-acetyltransferase
MISSRDDYEFYLEADKIALGIEEHSWPNSIIDERYAIWRFERLLRKFEYYLNCKRSWGRYIQYLSWRFYNEGRKLGFSIHPNNFGPGLSIAHPGTLIVNGNARVGKDCRIHNCVHIATQVGSSDAVPKIGDHVFIGPGTVILGDIIIGDDILIGANSLVNRSFPEKGISIAGNPARIIGGHASAHNSHGRATEIVMSRGSVEIIEYSHCRLVVINRGRQTWTKDTLLRIGVVGDQPSACYHPGWISPNRICTFSEEKVAPGETATFNFTLNPANLDSERFQLVIEGVCWIPNTEFGYENRVPKLL